MDTPTTIELVGGPFDGERIDLGCDPSELKIHDLVISSGELQGRYRHDESGRLIFANPPTLPRGNAGR